MSVGEMMKSGPFVLGMLVAVLVGLPFAVEQIGEATDLYRFPAQKWVKGLFSTKTAADGPKTNVDVNWADQAKDLQAFSDWVAARGSAKISIVRPDKFQIEKANADPVTTSQFAYKLLLISDTLSANEAQIRNKLSLICEPEDRVSGQILSVKALSGGEKGFLVTVGNVRGQGKIGLSYDGEPPISYNVQLPRLWLVPVASCRSAMKGRYDSAVFFPGLERGLQEGEFIAPGKDRCGYRILSISDFCVWFEAFYDSQPSEEVLPRSVWPDFSRVDTMPPTPPPGRLLFGKSRCFWPGDAIKLPNSGWYLMVDDFLGGRAAVFRLLDAKMRSKRELLCVIVRERQ